MIFCSCIFEDIRVTQLWQPDGHGMPNSFCSNRRYGKTYPDELREGRLLSGACTSCISFLSWRLWDRQSTGGTPLKFTRPSWLEGTLMNKSHSEARFPLRDLFTGGWARTDTGSRNPEGAILHLLPAASSSVRHVTPPWFSLPESKAWGARSGHCTCVPTILCRYRGGKGALEEESRRARPARGLRSNCYLPFSQIHSCASLKQNINGCTLSSIFNKSV